MPAATADQAEIVRCNQKDEYYSMFIKRSLGDIAQSVFGPRAWLHWKKELDLVAEVLYFGLTTLSGCQTVGEEYVNILQVDDSKRKIPSRYHRGAMILLQVVAPYLLDHILTFLQNQVETNAMLSISQETRKKTVLAISVTRHLVSLLHRCHLAVFYVNGMFYHIAKRIVSIHYLSIRHWKSGTETALSNYRILGWLSVIQLSVTFLQHLYHHLKRISSEQLDGHLKFLSSMVPDRKASAGTDESGSNQADASRRCPLCLESRKQSTATPCGHLFCWGCITSWCANKAECPLCREKFAMSRLIFLQNYDPN